MITQSKPVSNIDLRIDELLQSNATTHCDFYFGDFYPNVTTLRSGICCYKSVCLSSVRNRASYSAG